MSNPHPFYRFSQGWNAGYYPDNQIMTDLINEMVGQLIIDLPSIYPGKTIDALFFAIKQWVKVYEGHPYYGRFGLSIQKIPDPPFNTEYNINVFNPDMAALSLSGGGFTINGFYNPTTNIVIGANVDSFTPGSFTGTFATPLINEEVKVSEALEIVNINGSAIFPITYSFDPISTVAISGLARGDNWFINGNGKPDRQPVPNLPYQNRRTFELPALNGDDNYILSVMERIIQASLDNPASIVTEYNKYTMPDGWTKSIANPSYTTYHRYQINYVNASRRKFILVGRYDGAWLWQRFVSDVYGNSPYNFMSAYSEVTVLPYEPLQAGRWLYNDDTFDFEFIEFTSDCYVSPEFYPMPAKPGDQYQFIIANGNLTGLNSVNIGLFKENGEFVQQIGNASLPTIVITGFGMYGNFGVRGTYQDWYDANYTPEYTVNFQMTDCDGNVIGDVLASIPVSGLTTGDFSEFKSVVEGLAWPDYLSVIVELDDDDKVIFTFTLTSTPICFCSITAWTYYEGSGETVYFIKPAIYEQAATPSQFYATCTIPAVKDGCYRLGLYDIIEDQPYLYSLSNIINIDRADCFSTILEFWSDDNTMAQGFEYFNNWKQRVRLGINGGGAKPVIEENLYRQSNGVHKRPQNKQDLSLDLHTDFLDLDTQLALVDATRHSYLVWDMKPIFVKGDIDVATIQDFTTQSSFETLAQVKFQALLQGFQPRNSSCLTC
jgi:hypothetical protein